jgi:hypothetical protein
MKLIHICSDWFCRGAFDFQPECRAGDGSDLAVEEFGAAVASSRPSGT